MENKGFYRTEQILDILGVRKTYWHEGVRNGIFPQPIKLGRISLWRKEIIHQLVNDIENGSIQYEKKEKEYEW